MQLEYFRLIDRIVSLDLEARTISVEADVPTEFDHLRGTLPRLCR